jgi:hypothetical protein
MTPLYLTLTLRRFGVTADASGWVAAGTVQEELATEIGRGDTRIQQSVHKAGDTDCSYISNGTHGCHYGTNVRATIEVQKA